MSNYLASNVSNLKAAVAFYGRQINAEDVSMNADARADASVALAQKRQVKRVLAGPMLSSGRKRAVGFVLFRWRYF